jgi:hypothetical protein
VDRLIDRGVECLTVVDISGAALGRARARLPNAPVTWIETDVTGEWNVPPVDFWHDRAVFHFLTVAEDRARYKAHLRRTLKVDGTLILATFAVDGPAHCSGLPVMRYSPGSLDAELGAEFQLIDAVSDEHRTPSGSVQSFVYTRFRRVLATHQS